jgi:hypothetical protein
MVMASSTILTSARWLVNTGSKPVRLNLTRSRTSLCVDIAYGSVDVPGNISHSLVRRR